MPLIKGPKAKTKEGMKANVAAEIRSGKKPSQAAAIAYSVAGKSKKK